MPATPLHYPLALGIHKAKRDLRLPAIVVGSVMPDIEVPILWYFFSGVLPDHLFLHSFVGALTVGVLLTVLVTRFLYAPIISFFFGVDKAKLTFACTLDRNLILSSVIGILSHLLLDYPMHWYNPLLWPWVDPFALVGPMVLLFTPFGPINGLAYWLANWITNGIMIGSRTDTNNQDKP